MNKRIITALILTALLCLVATSGLASSPAVEVSGPVEVTRSQLVNREVIDYDEWNYNVPWSLPSTFDEWNKTGIVLLLSKIQINGQNIAPQNGDAYAYTRMHKAMGGGTTSFIQKMNPVLVMSAKARKVPVNMPLNVYGQLKKENTYIAPYTFKTNYKVDYSSYQPLFVNDFILTDDYRQVTFKFEDGETHGRFTGPIKKITFDSYEDTEVPNNVIGLLVGQTINQAGLTLPEYNLDDGWVIKEYRDENNNVITLNNLLSTPINENRTFTIILHQPIIDVVVPAIWYPIEPGSHAVMMDLIPKPTYPDM